MNDILVLQPQHLDNRMCFIEKLLRALFDLKPLTSYYLPYCKHRPPSLFLAYTYLNQQRMHTRRKKQQQNLVI